MSTEFKTLIPENNLMELNGNSDLFSRIRKNRGPLGRYASVGEGYYFFPELKGELGNRMEFNGKKSICWSINNYLGLANHPDVRKADADASEQWGLAYPMGARMMTGETHFHRELENGLSEFVNKKACCILNFGYQGMVSCIDSLLSRHDVVIYDAESHACILDGIRLHAGKRFSFLHNNILDLEKQLEKAVPLAHSTGGGVLVISEGVFGMRGDQGKLKEIVQLKESFPFRLLVDDAHGFGTMGPGGSGTGMEQNVQEDIDIYFGTFAKSMALIGGFIAGESDIIQFLKYNMRSQVFAKSMPLPIVLGALKRLEIIRTQPELKKRLWENVNMLQQGLRKAGFDIGCTSSPVTPVFLKGTPEEASQLVYDLRENYGIFCSMIIYPIIPKGEILLRLIPTSVHTKEDIEQTLAAFEKISMKLTGGYYNSNVLNPLLKQ